MIEELFWSKVSFSFVILFSYSLPMARLMNMATSLDVHQTIGDSWILLYHSAQMQMNEVGIARFKIEFTFGENVLTLECVHFRRPVLCGSTSRRS